MKVLAGLRLSTAVAIATAFLFGLAFALGSIAGWTWSSRDKVCVTLSTPAGYLPACDYGFDPPPEAFVQ